MKALRKTAKGAGHVAVVEVPEPFPGKNQVRIRVACAGICGTDLHIFHGDFAKVRPPVTLGHEVAGTVDAVGEGVTAWQPGDRVTVESEAHTCGRCEMCTSGRANLCADRLALGYGVDGGFADALVVRQSALHRLPDRVSFQEGALSEPLTVAVHAVSERSRLKSGDWALITGPGPIGLLVLQVVRAAGGHAIVTGTARDAGRLQLAKKLGAEAAVRVDEEDLPLRVAQITEGQMVASAFECSGVGAAIGDCLTCLRSGGEIVQVGLYGRPISLDMDQVAMREIVLKGAFVHTSETWKKAIALMAVQAVDLSVLVSENFSIHAWEEAFRRSESGEGIKYLLSPEETV
ncbi:MAG: alcohol dehydrogenase catalytic domain-containing protein [Desulfobacteraceae bacterium]|nr:alcohol dehydrogenase catalytic domain-containing protein [Desulfobacteraceae bacterium]MBC2750790.1 zinc-binding dehydrogenase [Desulfobacteraceae bacterium]